MKLHTCVCHICGKEFKSEVSFWATCPNCMKQEKNEDEIARGDRDEELGIIDRTNWL